MTNITQLTAKIESTIDDMCREEIAIDATMVANRVVEKEPNISTAEYEQLRQIADDSLARRFDPLMQGHSAEELSKHADALEAWNRNRQIHRKQ